LEAFPKQLKSDTTKESISLKYRIRTVDGTASWIGLRATKGSADLWRRFLVSGSDIPEIAVLVKDENGDDPLAETPILGRNGALPSVEILRSSGVEHIPGAVYRFVGIPSTYQVRNL